MLNVLLKGFTLKGFLLLKGYRVAKLGQLVQLIFSTNNVSLQTFQVLPWLGWALYLFKIPWCISAGTL